VLKRAQRGHVQLWNPSRQHEHALGALDLQVGEHVRETIRLALQLGVGELPRAAVLAQKAQGDGVGKGAACLSVDRPVGDVQPSAG
jgi:hypothetical protein